MSAAQHGSTPVERARLEDAEAIAALLARNRGEASLILQSAAHVRAHIADTVVIRGGGSGLLACAQLQVQRPEIAELMGVAVAPDAQGRGLGSACVRALLERAAAMPLELVWLATGRPGFFARLGFVAVPMTTIPWSILLAKLPLVLRQPARRWPAALVGGQVFMRWAPG